MCSDSTKGIHPMSNNRLKIFTIAYLVIDGILGIVGSFSPPTVRGFGWAWDIHRFKSDDKALC